MIRALLLCAIVGTAACAGSPCDGVSGACLGIRVTSGPAIDQLGILLSGAVTLDAVTPMDRGPLRTPPLETAVELPSDAAGTLDVEILGQRTERALAAAETSISIEAGEHRTIELALAVIDATDMGATTDLADVDLATADLGGADLSAGVRYLFLLPMRSASLGSPADVDDACTSAAHTAGLAGSSSAWRAMLGFVGDGGDPATRLGDQSGRPIVLPDGTTVFSDGSPFAGDVSAEHAIDELATGEHVSESCVWTGFAFSGSFVAGETAVRGACENWTYDGDDSDAGLAYVGTTDTANQPHWSFNAVTSCTSSCYVYCLEE